LNYIFLTQQFYTDYKNCTEIEQKQTRPYVQVYIKVNGVDFAIPMRSHIKHKDNVFWTDRQNQCGLDFTKAVVIEDKKYIDKTLTPYIRPHEHSALIGKEHEVKQGMTNCIANYKEAKNNPTRRGNVFLLKYSTLQYFEKYIYKKDNIFKRMIRFLQKLFGINRKKR